MDVDPAEDVEFVEVDLGSELEREGCDPNVPNESGDPSEPEVVLVGVMDSTCSTVHGEGGSIRRQRSS